MIKQRFGGKSSWVYWCKWLLALKLFFALAATLGEFRLPQIIRQIDTMGVSLRFWLRWTVESELHHPLLPAVLSAGDGYGLAPAEFPLLNILYAPFFALPIEYARIAAWFTHVALSAALTWVHYNLWRGKAVAGVDAGKAALLLPLIGVSSVFAGRFMPDYIAMLLFSMALAISWDQTHTRKSFVIGTIGLLIKPPVVLAGAIYFFLPRRRWRHQLLWIIPAVLAATIYYKTINTFITTISDFPDYYLSSLRNPLSSLRDFVAEPLKVLKLVLTDILSPPYLIVITTFAALMWTARKRYAALLAVLSLQILGGAALDGSHSFLHIYYFIGSAMISSLLVVAVLDDLPLVKRKWLAILVLILILITQVEQGLYEFNNTLDAIRGRSLYSQCADLKSKTPQVPWRSGTRFRSEFSFSPQLGLCFGEIQNSRIADYGFYFTSETTPKDCQQIAATKDLKVVSCVN